MKGLWPTANGCPLQQHVSVDVDEDSAMRGELVHEAVVTDMGHECSIDEDVVDPATTICGG